MDACNAAQRWLVRLVEGDADVPHEVRLGLEAHLARCAHCSGLLAEQQLVSAMLRSRPPQSPSPAFAARLAARLDGVPSWLGMLNWRAWTFRLAPVAVALGIVALLTTSSANTSDTAAAAVEEWATPAEASANTYPLWQYDTTTETLLERMLTEPGAASTEPRHVR